MPSVPTLTTETAAPGVQGASRIAGIDGLRALAVLGVMAFHADYLFARGGFLGVDLFFVISGFLITRLLLAELERSGRISFQAFYLRRARRILPAMLLAIAGAALAAVVLAPDALPLLRKDALASVLFVTNWHFIVQQLSYFEYIGRQPLLQHLWSLAIEEQFYLVWPLVVLALASRGGRRALGWVAATLAVASVVWMGVLAGRLGFPETMAVSRVYFGTDTHAVGLLAGAALAAVAPRLSAAGAASGAAAAWGGALLGLAGLAGTLFLFSNASENHLRLYPWAFAASALCSVAMIVACLMPGWTGRLLDLQPLRWIGERSYGLYLWHWPVFMLTRPGVDVALDQDQAALLRVAVTFALAALSYRFVEAPILGRRLDGASPGPQFAGGALAALCCAAVFILIPAQRPSMPTVKGATEATRTASGSAPTGEVGEAAGRAPQPPEQAVPAASATPAGSTRAPPPLVRGYAGQLTVVGDSVALGARSALERGIDGAAVYATVGWQAADVLKILERIRAAGDLQPKVLIHLGTNGYVTERQLRAMLEMLRDRERVLVMNSRVPRRWMAANNRMLATVVPQFPNAVLIDWHSLSDDRPEFFVQDGVHLTGAGMRAFVGAVVAAGDFRKAPPADGAAQELRPLLAPIMPEASEPEDYSPTLVRHTRPMAPDSFWQTMARCETGNNWQNGGEYAGGLGIYVGTWGQWGGREFAPAPDQATPAQQIVVANRVSTQGWMRPDGRFERPVGFSGWGCLKTVGRPRLMMFTTESLLAQRFRWQQRGQAVRDLQLVLGVPVDGVYQGATAIRHREILVQRGLPPDLAAAAPAQAAPGERAVAGPPAIPPSAPPPAASALESEPSAQGDAPAASLPPAAGDAAPPPVAPPPVAPPTVAPEGSGTLLPEPAPGGSDRSPPPDGT
jgi:peptidoglycan/LPS O-acetylase OafA/YrhL